MKILFTIVLYLIPLTALTQNTIESYQYWFNSDNESMISGLTGQDPDVPVYSFSASIGSEGQPEGLHVLNMRFRDSGKKWSPVLSRFFYKMPSAEAGDVTIDRVSYWFNNDLASATEEVVSGSGSFLFDPAIAADGLADGLHVLNLRFRDSGKKWSPVMSRFFYKMPATADSEAGVSAFSYWFNDDTANALEQPVTQSGSVVINEKFDAASLADGLHVFNIRFKDNKGKWSGTLSRFFYKMPVSDTLEENLVTAYRYWFNEDEGEITRVDLGEPVNPLHLLAEIETPYLEPGGHAVHIQFLDLRGKWSPALTSEFETEECAPPRYINDPEGAAEVCHGSVEVYTVQAALNTEWFEWTLTPAEAGTVNENGSLAEVTWNETFSGNAILSVIGSNPCGETDAMTLGVEVIPQPFVTAMANTSICEGESIELTVDDYTGTLEWNVYDPVVSPAVETIYTVAVTNICGSAEDHVVIGVDTHPSLSVMEDVVICEGEEVELTAASNGAISWSSGSPLVSPLETTTYTVTAILGECTVEDEVTVTVNPLPSLTVMDDVAICEGEEVELTAASDGAVSWSSGSPLVSPLETTTYTATASLGECTVEDEVTVTVNPLPSLTVMDDVAICEGDEVELTAASDGAISWGSGSPLVSPLETTTYTVTASLGECTVEDEVTVTVNPLPSLTVMDDVAICEGEEVELTAISNGTVTWSSGTEIISPVESNLFTAFAEKEGCVVQQDLFVTVHPVPETPVLEQVDETLISSSESGNVWFFNNEELEDVSGPEYSPEANGEYYVRIISSMGCISEPSNIIAFIASNLTIIGMSEITVFPNPVYDELYINPGNVRGEIFRAELMTLDGKVLLVRELTEESYINVAGLAPSVYILRISLGNESRVFRIIKN